MEQKLFPTSKNISKLTISESEFNLKNGNKGKLVIFIYSGERDPKSILNLAICEFCGDNKYNEFIDDRRNNPWMRVLISDINNIEQKEYDFEYIVSSTLTEKI